MKNSSFNSLIPNKFNPNNLYCLKLFLQLFSNLTKAQLRYSDMSTHDSVIIENLITRKGIECSKKKNYKSMIDAPNKTKCIVKNN